MIKIGITGGIGSGKSYVSSLLAQRGMPVFDCDSQAKTLMLSDSQIRSGLTALLGEEVYTSEGINKPLLASFLFASKENAERINAIVHPRVKDAFRVWTLQQQKLGKEWVAMESAILYESGFYTEVDQVLMIHAPLAVRCKRVVLRDHTSLKEVQRRIASQLPDEDKCNRADFIIENDGENSLKDQIDQLFSYLKGIKGDK